jgi:hypothetical protein
MNKNRKQGCTSDMTHPDWQTDDKLLARETTGNSNFFEGGQLYSMIALRIIILIQVLSVIRRLYELPGSDSLHHR